MLVVGDHFLFVEVCDVLKPLVLCLFRGICFAGHRGCWRHDQFEPEMSWAALMKMALGLTVADQTSICFHSSRPWSGYRLQNRSVTGRN